MIFNFRPTDKNLQSSLSGKDFSLSADQMQNSENICVPVERINDTIFRSCCKEPGNQGIFVRKVTDELNTYSINS